MQRTSSLIFFIVLIASGICADTTTVNPITETTLSSQTEPTVTTTVPSTTSQKPDTTTAPTTTVTPSTSTVPPETTSSAPPTTTTVITTTVAPTTTPTPKPTTIPPVTTVKPPEPPTPVDGLWNVTEGNTTCIRVDLKVRFKIFVKEHVDYIVLYPNATSSGSCEAPNATQELRLEDSEFTLIMTFEKDATNVYMKNVTFSYTLPDAQGEVHNDTRLFSVKLGNSYMCDSSSDVILGNVTMEVFRIRIQAFGSAGNKDFGTAEDCAADNKINDMVPIAVGIALLALVVVVLIAYFVGRRRSRQKGYQSV